MFNKEFSLIMKDIANYYQTTSQIRRDSGQRSDEILRLMRLANVQCESQATRLTESAVVTRSIVTEGPDGRTYGWPVTVSVYVKATDFLAKAAHGAMYLYTDGSHSEVEGTACAWILVHDDEVIVSGAAHLGSVSSRCGELQAAILGLETIPQCGEVILRSDLRSLTTAVERHRTLASVAAEDVTELNRAISRHGLVIGSWVRGHSTNQYNRLVDKMAAQARKSGRRPEALTP